MHRSSILITGGSADETDFISDLEAEADGEDIESDDSGEDVSDSVHDRTSARPVKELIKIIKQDISKLITFSDEEYQVR